MQMVLKRVFFLTKINIPREENLEQVPFGISIGHGKILEEFAAYTKVIAEPVGHT